MRTGSQFSSNEQQLHINVFEPLAAFFGIKTFAKMSDAHVKILSDNTTTVYGIDKMGWNNFNTCYKIICDIWDWAEQNNIWITSAIVAGKHNDEDQKEFQRLREKDNWSMLKNNVFEKFIQRFQVFPKIEIK